MTEGGGDKHHDGENLHKFKSLAELTDIVDQYMNGSHATTFKECLTESLEAFEMVSIFTNLWLSAWINY